jgi:hypothetical protein
VKNTWLLRESSVDLGQIETSQSEQTEATDSSATTELGIAAVAATASSVLVTTGGGVSSDNPSGHPFTQAMVLVGIAQSPENIAKTSNWLTDMAKSG